MNDSVPQVVDSRQDQGENRRDLLILLLILLIGFACLLITAQIAAQPIDPWRIDVSMRSEFDPNEGYEGEAMLVEPIIPEVMTIPAWAPGGKPASSRGEVTVIPPLSFSADTATPAGNPGVTTATPTPQPTQPAQTGIPSRTPTASPEASETPTPPPTTSTTPTPPPTTSATPTPPPTSSAVPTLPPTQTALPTNTTAPTNTPLPPPTSTPLPTNTPIPPPTSTPQPTNTPEPTHVPPGQTRTPPGLTHAPTQGSNSGREEELSSGDNGAKLPLALVIGSVGLFFTAQASAWRVRLRPKRQPRNESSESITTGGGAPTGS